MTVETQQVARTVRVGSRAGLHARPAAVVVKAANDLASPVFLAKPGGRAVNARSILSVLGLDANRGDEVVVSAEGDGAAAAVDAIADLVAQELDDEQPAGSKDGGSEDGASPDTTATA